MSQLHRNFVTPVGRASYVHVWEKSEMPNGEMKYNMAILFPKANKEDIESIKKAIMSAAVDFFGEDRNKWPEGMDNPLRDGDKGDRGEAYKGMMYMNPKSDKAPGIVGPDAKPLMNQDDFYSGCFCRISVNFYGYRKAGNTGVGVGLNNVMKIKDGDRLDGRKSAESEFAEFASETSSDEFFGDSE